MKNTCTIGCAGAKFSQNKIFYFRKKFTARTGGRLDIKIFADAAYKLYINGEFVGAGPAKGNDGERYFDERALGEYLTDGENEMLVSVLCLACAEDLPGHRFVTSLLRSGRAALEISGTLDGVPFATDESWECAEERAVDFLTPEYAYYTGICEHVRGELPLKWTPAQVLISPERHMFCGEPSLWRCKKSPIPLMKLTKMPISLAVGEVYDAGAETTAYLEIAFRGSGRVKITYAEKYFKDGSEKRDDADGEPRGDFDLVEVCGERIFRPYWARVFRYIRIEADGDVEITAARAIETRYPIEISDNYDFGDDTDNALWKISRRTLEQCMRDTYTDCPYYEQLQYTLDTYLQCIFSYQVSGDDRLWRRAIRDFALSADADGLTASRTPSVQKQFIPSFALCYILMVLTHYDFCGDFSLVEENVPYMLRIISWYKRHSDERALVSESEFWHFIDWAEDFMPGHGVPVGEEGAALGVESLMLCYTLRRAAAVLSGTVFDGIARDWAAYADRINQSADKYLYSEERGLYANTENKRHFCQHAQIWATLSGCAKGARARSIMEKSFEIAGGGASYAYAYFLFRALDAAGIYKKRREMLDSLRRLVGLGCTTVPETPTDARSECHAWGAVCLYEFTAMDLGVRKIGGEIVVRPYTAERDRASGTVYIGGRAVFVSWEKKDGRVEIHTRGI